MNRSVITGTIAAVVLSAGAALVAAAPAEADPAGSDSVSGGDSPAAERTDTPRRRVPALTRTPGGEAAVSPTPPWPCPWPPPIPSVPVRPGNAGADNGGSGLGLIAALQPAPVRPPTVATLQQPELPEFTDLEMGQFDEAMPQTPADAPAAAPPAAPAVPPAPPPRAAPAPTLPAAPAPTLPAAPPADSQPPAPLAGAATPPQARPPAGEPPVAVRHGYPEELRNADVTTVAAVALPGLAAIAGMTALGGLIGYRQAKAGFVLQAAGAGRFLQ